MDLTAWTDMEVFRRLPKSGNDKIKDERDKKAMEIREKWLSKNYFFGPNTPGTKTAIKKVSFIDCGQCPLLPEPLQAESFFNLNKLTFMIISFFLSNAQ